MPSIEGNEKNVDLFEMSEKYEIRTILESLNVNTINWYAMCMVYNFG